MKRASHSGHVQVRSAATIQDPELVAGCAARGRDRGRRDALIVHARKAGSRIIA